MESLFTCWFLCWIRADCWSGQQFLQDSFSRHYRPVPGTRIQSNCQSLQAGPKSCTSSAPQPGPLPMSCGQLEEPFLMGPFINHHWSPIVSTVHPQTWCDRNPITSTHHLKTNLSYAITNSHIVDAHMIKQRQSWTIINRRCLPNLLMIKPSQSAIANRQSTVS